MSAVATLTQLLMGALVLMLPAGDAEAAGSWVATAPGVRAVMVDRDTASAPLSAPDSLVAGQIDSVVWQYRVAPGEQVRARLCHADGCLPLQGSRGTSQALAGLPAGTSLHFRFSLVPGQRGAVAVQGLQVIVNYR